MAPLLDPHTDAVEPTRHGVPDKIRDAMIPENKINLHHKLMPYSFPDQATAKALDEIHILVQTRGPLGVNPKWLQSQQEEGVYALSKGKMKFVNRDDTVQKLLDIHFFQYQGTQDGVWGNERQIPLADNIHGLGKTEFCLHCIKLYMAWFACYEVNGVLVTTLLAMAPLMNEPDDEVALRVLGDDVAKRLRSAVRPVSLHRRRQQLGQPFASYNHGGTPCWLLEFLDAEDDDIMEVLTSPASNKRLRGLFKELKDVEFVAKALQGRDVDLQDVRQWFDELIALKPQFETHIGSRAEIVHSPDFESGCVRVLSGRQDRLTRAEKTALGPFAKLAVDATAKSDDEDLSFVEGLRKAAGLPNPL
ncbi:hypothetical protein F442_03769 [Phytophthora nicotianae P10297]|uniref:Uncharacterized protein n=1 Tax=Phytophthora nicotianae P10297 TaxID=1317064 RepID=W2ZVG4_PHYNI|nr:hypothetical protein F442_03769 [Phytophthora nicotianae P10297]